MSSFGLMQCLNVRAGPSSVSLDRHGFPLTMGRHGCRVGRAFRRWRRIYILSMGEEYLAKKISASKEGRS